MEHSVQAEGVRRLILRLRSGDVTLSESGGTHVEGTVEAAREPRIDQHDSWLTIQSGRQDAAVRLAVPAGIDVQIRTRSGDVTSRVPLGSVSVATGSGDVRLTRVTGSAEASTDSGDVDISELEGDGQVRSGSGDITVGRLGRSLDIKNGSGDVTVASNRGQLFVRASSGDVSVGVPEGCPTWLDLVSASGEVHVMLPEAGPAAAGPADSGPAAGHSSIRVTTASGDIRIARA